METDYQIWQEIQPANPYVVQSEGVLSEFDRKTLFSLYLPIIGSQALALYMTLWDEIFQKPIAHFRLLTQLNMSLTQLVEARKRLESLGLLQTYRLTADIQQFVYEPILPATPKTFFNDPLLNALLYAFTDDAHYLRTKSQFELNFIDRSGYENISATFTDCFELEFLQIDVPGSMAYAPTRQRAEVPFDQDFDEQLFFMNLPKGVLAPNYFTKEMLEVIRKQAYIYDIPANEMALLVTQSTTNQQLDVEQLRKDARTYYRMQKPATKLQFSTTVQPGHLRQQSSEKAEPTSPREKIIAMFETTAPLNFLSNRLGRNPNQFERELLEKMLVEYHLQPGVVNVILDYSLHNTENQFRANYIEKVAASWSTQNLKTVTEAMALAKKSSKAKAKALATPNKSNQTASRKGSGKTRTEVLPDWNNDAPDLTQEQQQDELARIKELMKDLK
ncbi:MAG: DnaD domain protein [Culicoidibacterales bacterium]